MTYKIVVKENVTHRLGVLDANVPNAVYNGLSRTMTKSTDTMATTVEKATTETGQRRVEGLDPLYDERPAWWLGNGPGRIESGRMIGSIGWNLSQNNHGAKGRAGFINNAPWYLLLQEKGTQKSGRKGRGIPPMLAYSAGKARFAALLTPTMRDELGKAVRAANRGQTLGRKT